MASSKPLLIAGDDGGNFKAFDYAAEMDLYTIQNLHQDFLRSLIFIDATKNHILSGGLDKTVKFIDINEKKHHNLLNCDYEVENLT